MFNAAGSFEFRRDKSLFYTGYKPSPLCTNNFVKIDEELVCFPNNVNRAIRYILYKMTQTVTVKFRSFYYIVKFGGKVSGKYRRIINGRNK